MTGWRWMKSCVRPVTTGDGIHLVLDSTGISVVGEGESAAVVADRERNVSVR